MSDPVRDPYELRSKARNDNTTTERNPDERDLAREIDELRAMMTGQAAEFRNILIEALGRPRECPGPSNPGMTAAAAAPPPPQPESPQYPPGYEPAFPPPPYGEEFNHPHWGPAARGYQQTTANELPPHGVNMANEEVRNLERMALKEELEEKLQEQIKALKGPSPYGPMGIKELSLASNVNIPRDFKMPEFIKFDGTSNPIMHLKMYCTKMGMWSQDEDFFISLFPESLEGAAFEWFMHLDKTQIRCWDDLALAFTNQYKFNLNVAPTRD